MLRLMLMLTIATTHVHAADVESPTPPTGGAIEVPPAPSGPLPQMPPPAERPAEPAVERQAQSSAETEIDKAASDKARKIMHDQLLQRSNEERGPKRKKPAPKVKSGETL